MSYLHKVRLPDRGAHKKGEYEAEEILIPDLRAQERPAQSVERKLIRLLNRSFVAVSDLRNRRLLTTR